MKRLYSGLHRRVSQSRSSNTSKDEEQNDEKPQPPRRSSSIALLERATTRRRPRSSSTPQIHPPPSDTPAHLVLTAEAPEIDQVTVRRFQEEGFSVSFLPYSGNPKEYDSQLQQLADPLEAGVKYAIVGM